MKLPPRTLPGGRANRRELPTGSNGLPLCRWCDLEILARRRRTFCSQYCVHQWRLRTDPGYLRDHVFARDRGICALCRADTVAIYAALRRARGPARAAGLSLYGLKSIASRRSLWDADHIRPVAEGGGQCDLDNLRTLCLPCHREVTAQLRLRLSRNFAIALPSAPNRRSSGDPAGRAPFPSTTRDTPRTEVRA